MIARIFKAFLCFLIVLVHLVIGTLLSLVPSPRLKRLLRVKSCHRLAKAAAWVLGIRVVTGARFQPDPSKPILAIANHIGYLDIVLFLSQVPCVFITSQELGANPILGPIARLGGSFLVDRQNKFNLKEEIRQIADLMRQGFPVFLFPEATSSDGSDILPFKRALLTAAIQTEARIYPFCINYLRVNGEPVTLQNRDLLFFYGEMDFVPHIAGLLKVKRIDVEVLSLDVVEVAPHEDSRHLGQRLEEAVRKCHRAIK